MPKIPPRTVPGDRRADVADQQGLKRTLMGLSLAVFLGMILRSSLNSDYVADQIRIAAQKIHQDLKIDFASARVSLSHHGIPELAAIVEDITFSTERPCWADPEGNIDELRLPLDFFELFQGRVEISRVKIGHMNLKLKKPWQECAELNLEGPVATAVPTSPKSEVATAASLSERSQPRGPIRALSIDSLKVEYAPFSDIPFEFEEIFLERKSQDNLGMELTGLLNLGGSSLSGDYASQADFYVDFQEPKINLVLSGTWREGKYQVAADYDTQKKDVGVKGSIDNLPLSQILNLLSQFNVLQGEYDSRQLWMSLKFETEQRSPIDKPIPVKIPEFSLEGDLGEVKADNLQVEFGSQFKVSPGEIRVRGLKPEKILTLLGRESKFKSFGSLGQMNGTILLRSLREWSFLGESSGLEVVFSNRGERRLQTLSVISGKADFNQGNWVLVVDKIRPLDGLFLGSLRLEGYHQKPEVDLELQIEELSLSNEVQALMSGNGSLGRWSGDLKAVFVRNEPKRLSGQMTGQGIAIEGLQANRIRIGLLEVGERIVADLKASGVEVAQGTAVRRFFATLFGPVQHSPETVLRAPQILGQVQMGTKTDELLWKIRPSNFEGISLQSEGGWSQVFELFGEVQVSYQGKEMRWRVEGDREKPVFIQK